MNISFVGTWYVGTIWFLLNRIWHELLIDCCNLHLASPRLRVDLTDAYLGFI